MGEGQLLEAAALRVGDRVEGPAAITDDDEAAEIGEFELLLVAPPLTR